MSDTRAEIVDAARRVLLTDGHSGLSTRKVADAAGVPVSQLHYHFGSKQGLLLAVLEEENRRRLDRQTRMYSLDLPIWQRYEQACDFLEDDLDSGYVRVLQEMIAEGWAAPAIGEAVRDLLSGWFDLLGAVVSEAEQRVGFLGPFTSDELATLLGGCFLGAESLLLLGFERDDLPIRSALRRIGVLIRDRETAAIAGEGSDASSSS